MWIWLFAIIVIEATALYTIKGASVNHNPVELVFSVLLYAAIPFCLYKIITEKDSPLGIATVNVVWNLASTIYGLIIGVVFFAESISTNQKIGIVLGTTATLLLVGKT